MGESKQRVFFNCQNKGLGSNCEKKVVLTKREATKILNKNEEMICPSCETEIDYALSQQCWSVSDDQ